MAYNSRPNGYHEILQNRRQDYDMIKISIYEVERMLVIERMKVSQLCCCADSLSKLLPFLGYLICMLQLGPEMKFIQFKLWTLSFLYE